MRAACRSMVGRGVTTFVDFREGGLAGDRAAQEGDSRKSGIRPVILGRVERATTMQEQVRPQQRILGEPTEAAEMVRNLRMPATVIGISGANENSDAVAQATTRTTPKLRAIHAAETECSVRKASRTDMTGRSEVERALVMQGPTFWST